MMPARRLDVVDPVESPRIEQSNERAAIKKPEVQGKGKMRPRGSVDRQTHGIAVGHGKVQHAPFPEKPRRLAKRCLRIVHVLETVAHDDGVERAIRQVGAWQLTRPNRNAESGTEFGGTRVRIDPPDLATARAQIHEQIAVSGSHFEDPRQSGPVQWNVDVKHPPGQGFDHGTGPVKISRTPRRAGANVANKIPGALFDSSTIPSQERVVFRRIIPPDHRRRGARIQTPQTAVDAAPDPRHPARGIRMRQLENRVAVDSAAHAWR